MEEKNIKVTKLSTRILHCTHSTRLYDYDYDDNDTNLPFVFVMLNFVCSSVSDNAESHLLQRKSRCVCVCACVGLYVRD